MNQGPSTTPDRFRQSNNHFTSRTDAVDRGRDDGIRLTNPHVAAGPAHDEKSLEPRETLVILVLSVLAIVWVMLIRSSMSGPPRANPASPTAASGPREPASANPSQAQDEDVPPPQIRPSPVDRPLPE